MAWLRKASEIDWDWVKQHVWSSLPQLKHHADIDAIIELVQKEVDAQLSPDKEATIVDFPSYERNDLNVGDSGNFDENAPVDMKQKTAPDPGPASLNPGQPGANAPQTFQ